MDRGIETGEDGSSGRETPCTTHGDNPYPRDGEPDRETLTDSVPPGGGPLPDTLSGPARPLDFVFLLRPMILIPVWTFFILGAHHGIASSGAAPDLGRLAAGIASFTALIGAVYIINQIADREVDRANRKLFFIPFGIIPVRAASIEAVLLIAVSFILGFLFLPLSYVAVASIGLVLGLAYSVGPLRLKGRPVLDVLSNAVGNGILNTLAGWTAAGAPLAGWEVLLPYLPAVASVHLATTLADIEGDRSRGLRTTGVVLGVRWGMIAATGLMVTAVGTASLTGNRLAFYASLLSLPFFLLPARKIRTTAMLPEDPPPRPPGKRAASRNVEPPPPLPPVKRAAASNALLPAKAATLIFSVTAGYLFPLYIPFLVAVILLTRLYYGRRFGMRYPSL